MNFTDNLRGLVRTAVQYACEVAIYAAERILETLAADRPLADEPLPADGDQNHWPDELWHRPEIPAGLTIAPELQPTFDRLMERARADFARPPFDPTRN